MGLTLEKVAKHVGVARNTVQRWESGERTNISYDKVPLLSEILEVSPYFLMGISEKKISKKKLEIDDPAEIKLVKAYRNANEDTKKAARAVLSIRESRIQKQKI